MLPSLPLAWLLRALWTSMPLTAGAALADGLADRSRPVAIVAASLAWGAWAATLLALLAPRPFGVCAVRVVMPAAVVATVLVADDQWWAAFPVAASFIALLPEVGHWMVNGSAYGDERRHLLRPPGTLLVGPIPLAWAALVAGATTGPLLLACRQWVAGALAVAVGAVVVRVTARALAALTERWLVLVPAGVVVKDHTVLTDPYLFRRQDMASLGPAPASSGALDLTSGAFGLALEIRLRQPATLLVTRGRREPQSTEATALLVTPTRPGAVLADAARGHGLAPRGRPLRGARLSARLPAARWRSRRRPR